MSAGSPNGASVLRPRTFIALVLVTVARLWWIESHPTVPNPNEVSRLYLTRAIVDDRALSIDAQARAFGFVEDFAEHDGRLYSDKAPGLSLLGVAPYATARLLGASPSPRSTRNLLWVTVIAVPACLLLVFLAMSLARFGLGDAEVALVVVGLGLGTPHGPYSMLLFGHALAGALVMVAFLAVLFVRRWGEGNLMLVLAGGTAGYAVLVEYPAAVPALCVAGYVASLGIRKLLVFLSATLPAILLIAWYHTAAFGGPLSTGYQAITGGWSVAHAHGLAGVSFPSWDSIWGLTLSSRRGLLFYSPWLLLAPWGFVHLWRERWRAEAAVGLVALAGSFYVAASFSIWWGGSAFGARHLTVVVPFVMLAAAALARRWRYGVWRAVLGGMVAASVVLTMGTAVPWPYPSPDCANPWASLSLPFWRAGVVPLSLPETLGFHRFVGAWSYVAIVIGALVTALLGERGQRSWRRGLGLAGALVLALAWAGTATLVGRSGDERAECDIDNLRSVVRAR